MKEKILKKNNSFANDISLDVSQSSIVESTKRKKDNKGKEILYFRNFTYRYYGTNEKVIIEGEFKVYKNEFVLLSGFSGAGKSTLLNILKGIIPQYIPAELTGEIFFNGINIVKKYPEELKSKVLLLFQNPYSQIVTPFVKDELVFPMENFFNDFAIIKDNFHKVVELFNLYNLLDKKTYDLSGGEIQKVLLASLTSIKPDLLLLDEPTSFLDPEARKEFFKFLLKLKGKFTILMVEHNLEDVYKAFDKLIYINKDKKVICLKEKKNIEKFVKNKFNFSNEINLTDVSKTGEITENLDFTFFKSKEKQLLIKNLYFKYKKQSDYLLENVNLSVCSEIISILGRNGAGKTTFLKLIAGILKPEKGMINTSKKDVAILFQNPETHFLFNRVEEEIDFNLKNLKSLKKINKVKRKKIVKKLLNIFGFEKYNNKSPFMLSEGEKKRLAFLLALTSDKSIILLDEPTFAQDFPNKIIIKDLIFLLKAFRKTIIIVTHDLDFAKVVSDRIYRLENKKLKVIYENHKI